MTRTKTSSPQGLPDQADRLRDDPRTGAEGLPVRGTDLPSSPASPCTAGESPALPTPGTSGWPATPSPPPGSRAAGRLAWYEAPGAHEEIAALLRWLTDRCELRGLDDAIYLVEKPHKWDAEYQRMLADEREAA